MTTRLKIFTKSGKRPDDEQMKQAFVKLNEAVAGTKTIEGDKAYSKGVDFYSFMYAVIIYLAFSGVKGISSLENLGIFLEAKSKLDNETYPSEIFSNAFHHNDYLGLITGSRDISEWDLFFLYCNKYLLTKLTDRGDTKIYLGYSDDFATVRYSQKLWSEFLQKIIQGSLPIFKNPKYKDYLAQAKKVAKDIIKNAEVGLSES